MSTRINPVLRARLVHELADLDYKRAILAALISGASDKDLKKATRTSGEAFTKLLAEAARVSLPKENFSGASPLEICERYASGLLPREQALNELIEWPYDPWPNPQDYWDAEDPPPPGTWEEVEDARIYGYIDDEFIKILCESEPPETP